MCLVESCARFGGAEVLDRVKDLVEVGGVLLLVGF